MKEKSKVKTEYSYVITVKKEYDTFTVEQEENILGREAILVKLFQERWRTPEDYIEFLEKVIIVIKRDFVE